MISLKPTAITLISLLVLLYGCVSEQSDYEKVAAFIHDNYQLKLEKYDYLIVVNEQGDCLNCNNAFSTSIARYIDNDNVLYLISSPGFNIDVSPYIQKEQENVLLDFSNHFAELNLVEKCAILDLGNNKIDTIIDISLSNVSTAPNFIQSF